MTRDYDFRHAAMHRLEEWPVLVQIAARHTKAKRLDSSAIAILYSHATDADWQAMTDAERAFGRAALDAYAHTRIRTHVHTRDSPYALSPI